MCKGINTPIYKDLDYESMDIITKNCVNLKEVDFSGAITYEATIRNLVNHISNTLEKINLRGLERLGDENVYILVKRFYEFETFVTKFSKSHLFKINKKERTGPKNHI